MEIKKIATAGTLESSDVSVIIEPNSNNEISIELTSTVEKQFGDQIKKIVLDVLRSLHVDRAIIKVNDKGALDCVITARVETAVYRAAEQKEFCWEA